MKIFNAIKLGAVALTLTCFGGVLWAQTVEVKDVWVRATVSGQKGTGAFMSLTAKEATKLVAVSTPVSGVAQIHEMRMDGDVMRMAQISSLDLPAGKTVELKPGSYHLMLMDLKQSVPVGTNVPLTLYFQNDRGAKTKLELKAPSRQ